MIDGFATVSYKLTGLFMRHNLHEILKQLIFFDDFFDFVHELAVL
jgi:hypothetical protein